jgi:hypothetical protein
MDHLAMQRIAPLLELADAGEQIDAEFHQVYQYMQQRGKQKKRIVV